MRRIGNAAKKEIMMSIKPRSKAGMIWFIILASLFVLLLVITIVITQNNLIYYTISSKFGGGSKYLKSGDPDMYVYYSFKEGDPTDKAGALAAANALNERICEEGSVLLKNDNDVLPLARGSKVTVLGRNSVDLVYGGSGSNAGASEMEKLDLGDMLESVGGFEYNPVVRSYYEGLNISRPDSTSMGVTYTGFPTAEAPVGDYPDAVKQSYSEYGDAAIVVITRICGEGYDLPRTMFKTGNSYTDWTSQNRTVVDGADSMDSHYLQLDKNERAVLKEACDNFSRVVLLINSAAPIELGILEEGEFADKDIAALWMAYPGESGLNAVGRLLNGEVTPSGRTVDTWSRNFKLDPAWQNFGNNLSADGNRYTYNGDLKSSRFVEYREGIYVGYRWFETRASYDESGAWYADNVVYPFGHGLSYTTFGREVAADTPTDSTLAEDGKLEFTVTVTNDGKMYSGKDVVQLYYSSPYMDGGIEKAHVALGDFAKTKELEPGESCEVTLSIDVRDMASYDYNDANGNEFKGWELDGGTYSVYIGSDAHSWADDATPVFTYTVPESGYRYPTDDYNEGAQITNLFDDESEYMSGKVLSRENGFADYDAIKGVADQREQSEFLRGLIEAKMTDEPGAPWYAETAPTYSKRSLSYSDCEVKLYDLIGKDYDDPLWDALLDQLTVSEMASIIETGNFRTLQLENIDKPLTIDADGPMGFALFMGDSSVYDTCRYACECLVGATFNRELAREQGRSVGIEGLVGNEQGDGTPYSGWYAPAVNLHRSPFSGRNFEYYSEDAFLSGEMGANVILGAKEYGVYTFVKHFALNDQETDRDNNGLLTWADEQTMREIYFKPFETCVKKGQTRGMMSAFNRIGATWAGSDHDLLTALLRDEWGFRGAVITDFNVKSYMDPDDMIRGGGDINLAAGKTLADKRSATAISCIRRAAKNIMFVVAGSNAMNGHGAGVIWGYTLPGWLVLLIVIDCVVGAGTVGWGLYVFLRRHAQKKKLAVRTSDGATDTNNKTDE